MYQFVLNTHILMNILAPNAFVAEQNFKHSITFARLSSIEQCSVQIISVPSLEQRVSTLEDEMIIKGELI